VSSGQSLEQRTKLSRSARQGPGALQPNPPANCAAERHRAASSSASGVPPVPREELVGHQTISGPESRTPRAPRSASRRPLRPQAQADPWKVSLGSVRRNSSTQPAPPSSLRAYRTAKRLRCGPPQPLRSSITHKQGTGPPSPSRAGSKPTKTNQKTGLGAGTRQTECGRQAHTAAVLEPIVDPTASSGAHNAAAPHRTSHLGLHTTARRNIRSGRRI